MCNLRETLANKWKITWIRLLVSLIFLIVPPALFHLIFVGGDVGKIALIPSIACGGEYYISKSEAGVFDRRLYDGHCVNETQFNIEEAASKSLEQSLGLLYAILEHQICFETKTTIDNSDYIDEGISEKKVVLEEFYYRPRSIRIELRHGYGKDIQANDCETIPFTMKNRPVTMKMAAFMDTNAVDGRFLQGMIDTKILTPVANEKDMWKNRLFFEETEIYVRPKYIRTFIYLLFLAAWIPLALALTTLYGHLIVAKQASSSDVSV